MFSSSYLETDCLKEGDPGTVLLTVGQVLGDRDILTILQALTSQLLVVTHCHLWLGALPLLLTLLYYQSLLLFLNTNYEL